MAMRDRPDSTGLLPTLRIPALVVVGAERPDQPPRRHAAPGRGERCVEIPAPGYLAPLEQPLAVGRALAEFLESLG
jgi:3-oxoadipate enol-lactonase